MNTSFSFPQKTERKKGSFFPSFCSGQQHHRTCLRSIATSMQKSLRPKTPFIRKGSSPRRERAKETYSMHTCCTMVLLYFSRKKQSKVRNLLCFAQQKSLIKSHSRESEEKWNGERVKLIHSRKRSRFSGKRRFRFVSRNGLKRVHARGENKSTFEAFFGQGRGYTVLAT